MPTLLERALIATRASRRIELKETFDPDEKDIAALANSGGGVVLFGVDRHAAPTGAALPSLAEARARSAGVLAGWMAGVSPAAAGRRRASRRDGGVPFLEFGEAVKFGKRIVTAIVPEAATPIVCDGVVYIRRGARSVPATTEELAKIVQRRVDAARREWLGAVRRVVREPERLVAVRVVQDRRAPADRMVDYDKTHTYRQKELLAAFRARVPGQPINQFDFLAVRTVHGTDDRPDFTHKPMFGSRQYSESFLDWLVAQARRDPHFFEAARRQYRSGMLSP